MKGLRGESRRKKLEPRYPSRTTHSAHVSLMTKTLRQLKAAAQRALLEKYTSRAKLALISFRQFVFRDKSPRIAFAF